MTNRKKIFRIAIIVVGAFLIFLLAVQLIVPKLINLESIKRKILASASEKVGGEVKCQRIRLSFFPHPHAVIDGVILSIPGNVSGSLDTLSVYPKILPLFRGKLYLSQVQVERPDFKVNLPEKPQGIKKGKEPTPGVNVEKALSQVLAPLALDALVWISRWTRSDRTPMNSWLRSRNARKGGAPAPLRNTTRWNPWTSHNQAGPFRSR